MNLVGKIFVVVILVMSVLFMAFAMAVYATHRNWWEVVELREEQVVPGKQLGLRFQLEKAKVDKKALAEQSEKLKQQIEAEKAEKTQAVAKLESEKTLALNELKELQAKQAGLEKAQREAVAAMNATQTNATGYHKELTGQRTTVEDARKDRDANFKEVMRLTDALHQAVNDRDQLKKKTDELAKDLAKADQVLRKFGLDKNKDYTDVPPVVDGVVTATPGAGLVEVSLGSDDGLLKGHKLQVYRIGGGQSTYVGRIEVLKAEPNRAVCKIDPKFQNSNVMVGDRVASKIE